MEGMQESNYILVSECENYFDFYNKMDCRFCQYILSFYVSLDFLCRWIS